MDSIIKNRLLIVQKNDPVLAKLLLEFYQKSLEYDSIAEDILKYVMTTEKEIKTSIILDSYMFKSIKHFKVIIINLELENDKLYIYFNHYFLQML